MFGSHDDTTLYLRLRKTWQYTGKVDDKVGTGMGNDSKVSILTLSNLLRKFYLQLVLIVVILTHNNLILCEYIIMYARSLVGKVDKDAEHLARILAPPAHGVETLFWFDDLRNQCVDRTVVGLQIMDNSQEVGRQGIA